MSMKRWAITMRLFFAVMGLLSVPIGTIINIYVLIILSGALSSSHARDRMKKKLRRRR
jgi:hypothetical protein